MGALKLGVVAGAPVIEGLILHLQTRLLIDPACGVVYGRRGHPIGWPCKDGYVRLGGKYHPYLYAHRLIWETVNGPIPPRLYIDHLNGRKADNRIANLEAVTPTENANRAIAMGLVPVGEAKSTAKLAVGDVKAIRASVGEVATREWARRLGVDPAVVRAVRQGRTWRHVASTASRRHRRLRSLNNSVNRPASGGGCGREVLQSVPTLPANKGDGRDAQEGDS